MNKPWLGVERPWVEADIIGVKITFICFHKVVANQHLHVLENICVIAMFQKDSMYKELQDANSSQLVCPLKRNNCTRSVLVTKKNVILLKNLAD